MFDKLKLKLTLAAHRTYGSNQIKYIFQRNRSSDILLVVFSGFPAKDEPARFNYVRTLLSLKVNKLFVLDDFGYQNRGSYYLAGRSHNVKLQDEIRALIELCRGKKRLVTAGSSKGGTAALLYGLCCDADAIIVGAPQYYIGNYLSRDDHVEILKSICGDATQQSIDYLNRILSDHIKEARNKKTKIYIHCSPLEHTYIDHVQDLIKYLLECGFDVEKNLDSRYTQHDLVGHYFSRYLFDTLERIIDT